MKAGADERAATEPIDLSVVIVSWNVRELLLRAVASIEAAPRPRTEIIVVDNASNDGSVDALRARFPHVRVVQNHRNRGFGPANNQAMALARGRTIMVLNPDTEVVGDVIPRALAELAGDDTIGILGVRVRGADGRPQPAAFRDPRLGHMLGSMLGLGRSGLPVVGSRDVATWRVSSPLDVEVVSGCCMFLPRDVLGTVGGFDEAFPLYGEEGDWCRRVRDAGRRVVFAPVGEIIHHGGASTAQLGAVRSVLLCRGVLRLVRRQGGAARAAGAWMMCVGYHGLRAFALSVPGLLGRSRARRAAAVHHWAVLRQLPHAWPVHTEPHVPIIGGVAASEGTAHALAFPSAARDEQGTMEQAA